MVLMKIPCLGNQLDDAWGGPNEVIRKISNTKHNIQTTINSQMNHSTTQRERYRLPVTFSPQVVDGSVLPIGVSR